MTFALSLSHQRTSSGELLSNFCTYFDDESENPSPPPRSLPPHQIPDGQLVEYFFPTGAGLVGRCVATCLPCQSRDPPLPSSPSRRYHDNTADTAAVRLSGPADLHGIAQSNNNRDGVYGGVGATHPSYSYAFRPQDGSATATTAAVSLNSTTLRRPSPGIPLDSETVGATNSCGGDSSDRVSHGRPRLAFFPPADNEDGVSRSPSPSRASIALSPGRGRGWSAPPGIHGGVWNTGGREGVDWGGGCSERRRVDVACVPVCGGVGGGVASDGDGSILMGVLKVG